MVPFPAFFGLRLFRETIEFPILGQFPEGLSIRDPFHLCEQGHAVPSGFAQNTVIDILTGIEEKVVLSWPVIAAEWAGGFHLLPFQRAVIQDKPTSPCRVQYGNRAV